MNHNHNLSFHIKPLYIDSIASKTPVQKTTYTKIKRN